MALKTITYIRPSGKEITVGRTKSNKAFAKTNKWKVKKETPKVEIDNGDSGTSGESDWSGDTGTSE